MTAQSSDDAARLMDLLGLDEDELCVILGCSPLELLSGQLDHRPELGLLLLLLADGEERGGAALLRRWVRSAGPNGRPIDQLIARDFAAFEDSLETLSSRGFILRAGGGSRSGGETS